MISGAGLSNSERLLLEKESDIMRVITLCVILILAFACDNSGVGNNGVHAEVTESAILLSNHTGRTVYYFAVGRNASALIDWVPIVSDENAILHDETLEIERSDVDPDRVETEVLVYWWHAVVIDNKPAPGEVSNFVVPLPENPF